MLGERSVIPSQRSVNASTHCEHVVQDRTEELGSQLSPQDESVAKTCVDADGEVTKHFVLHA